MLNIDLGDFSVVVNAGNQEMSGSTSNHESYPWQSSTVQNGNQQGSSMFMSHNYKVIIGDVPDCVTKEQIRALLPDLTKVVHIEALRAYEVTYVDPVSAARAVTKLDNYDYRGVILRVDEVGYVDGGGPSGLANLNGFRGNAADNFQVMGKLRILVDSDMVGAIIGRQGSIVQQISRLTKTRVNINVADFVQLNSVAQKSITIQGRLGNCSDACKKILEIIKKEPAPSAKSDVALKMLAHHSMVGLIIGRHGHNVNKIMEITETEITVCSISGITNLHAERVIVVKGTLDNMSHAESLISHRLRHFRLPAYAPAAAMFPEPASMV